MADNTNNASSGFKASGYTIYQNGPATPVNPTIDDQVSPTITNTQDVIYQNGPTTPTSSLEPTRPDISLDPTRPINPTIDDQVGPTITNTQDVIYQNGPGGQNPTSGNTDFDSRIDTSGIDLQPTKPINPNTPTDGDTTDSPFELVRPDISLDPTKPIPHEPTTPESPLEPVKPDIILDPTKPIPHGDLKVYFKYNQTQNACEKINNIANKIKESIEQIQAIVDKKDDIWRGIAGEKFWKELEATGKEYSLKNIEEIISTKIPKATKAVINLIEQNKSVDSKLMSHKFTYIKVNDNVKANSVTTNAEGVNTQIISDTHANDYVRANSASVSATGVNQELNNSVKANDNIQASSAATDAKGVNTQIINDTHIEGNITANSANITTSSINKDTINSVGVISNTSTTK